MSKFTKGPWKIVEHSWSDTGIYSEHDRIALLSIGDEIDEGDQERFEEIQRANANLIASAPEMYEALEKLARLGNEPHYGNSVGNEIALDALRKAGGGK